MTYYQFGNLTVSSLSIAVVLAFILAPIFFSLITKSKIGEWYWDAILNYILIWKFSYILFNFKLFIGFPMGVVYYDGGLKGHLLGLVYLTIYLLFFVVRKDSSQSKVLMTVTLLFIISFEVIQSLLNAEILTSIFQSVLLVGMLLLFIMFEKRKTTIPFQLYLLLLFLEFWMVSIFGTILSTKVVTFSWIFIIALLSRFRLEEING